MNATATQTSQPHEAVAVQPAKPKWRWSWQRFGGKFLVLSVAVHILLISGAAVWVVQEIQAKRKLTFKAGEKSPNPSTRAIEHKVQVQKKKSTMTAPAQAKRIATTGLSKVTLPDMPTMATATTLTPNSMSGAGGTGNLPGLGGFGGKGGAGGGGPGINFFGLRTNAKRIAFLLDYSGSMSGPFRLAMEKELERALKKLPQGTQILLIPWAGPAWLSNETAPQIMSKWKKGDNYDDFSVVNGAELAPPSWIAATPENVTEVMKNMRAQVAAPGGTDWRQPFRYAMEVKPPPDAIFFMTDGQIPPRNVGRALSAIDSALKRASTMPQVNCLWIQNPEQPGDDLKKLATKYKGEFRAISAVSGSKD